MLSENKSRAVTVMKDIIRYAIMAPSGHNTQPWLFSIDENVITIHPDYSKRLPVVDPDDHALFISLGCALENMVIAARHYGFEPSVDLDPESDEIKVAFTKNGGADDNRLFEAIPQRQAARRTYDGNPIPEKDLEALRNASVQDDVLFRIFKDPVEIEPLVEFVKEGNRLQFSNNAFVNELISWIRFKKSEAQRQGDGLNSASMGAPSVPQWLGRLFLNMASAEGEAKKCEKAIKSSSALMMFIAEDNSKRAWINLGRSFERVALTATRLNIRHAHLNMPCEEQHLRKKLQNHLNLTREQPLLLLRIGYADPMPCSLRRPVEQVIIN
ncbi:MAG: hypothetical protein U5R06_08795 [candidate division KSB1 bacterium]|nr:hypothetical protein [candidate division KSB1 bacterium]